MLGYLPSREMPLLEHRHLFNNGHFLKVEIEEERGKNDILTSFKRPKLSMRLNGRSCLKTWFPLVKDRPQ